MRETGGGSFAGALYDLKQTQTHRSTDMTEQKYGDIVTDFIKGGWNDSAFQKFYRAPQTLYNVQIFTPYMKADEGPKAFHVSGEVKPKLWVALYKGRVSPPETGTYHFVGAGDDLLIVRFNGQVVLDGSWNPHGVSSIAAKYDYGFSKIPNKFVKGPAVSVTVGNYYEMEVLIGEQPGGEFFADLFVEKDGAKYEKESHGSPVLPIFRVADGKMPALRSGEKIPPFQPNGPVWRAEVVKEAKK
ncbi:MAG TPA: PA14 domain-containing protein [Chthoniobacterales bacterium]